MPEVVYHIKSKGSGQSIGLHAKYTATTGAWEFVGFDLGKTRLTSTLQKWLKENEPKRETCLHKFFTDKLNIFEGKSKLPFGVFWHYWKRKQKKPSARAFWNKLSRVDQEAIIKFLPDYNKAHNDPNFIPMPENFIKNRVWEDPITLKAEKVKTVQKETARKVHLMPEKPDLDYLNRAYGNTKYVYIHSMARLGSYAYRDVHGYSYLGWVTRQEAESLKLDPEKAPDGRLIGYFTTPGFYTIIKKRSEGVESEFEKLKNSLQDKATQIKVENDRNRIHR
jgi:hypothetical protein